jgi:ankyrin repeat protein
MRNEIQAGSLLTLDYGFGTNQISGSSRRVTNPPQVDNLPHKFGYNLPFSSPADIITSMRNAVLGLALLAASLPLPAQEDHEKLYAAIRSGDMAGLKALLDSGISANAADGRQITPLMDAAEVGSADAMRLLLDRGAEVNAQNALGATALMWSAADLNKVRLLLDHGADVNKAARSGRTALMLAAFTNPSAEAVRLLLAKGPNVNAADGRQWTALNAAAFGNDTASLRMLLEAGADPNIADTFIGWTPLMNAAGNANLESVKLLLARGAKVNANSKRTNLPTIKTGTVEFGGFTALSTAAPFAAPELVKTLLDAGAEVNTADIRGFTPLMLAAATDRQNPENVRLILAHGADLKPKTLDGDTALDWARKIGVKASIQTLGGTAKAPERAPAGPTPDARTAVERSVRLLEKSSAEFFTKSACFACHEQPAATLAVAAARARGIAVDEQADKERLQQMVGLNATGPASMDGPGLLGGADNNLYAVDALVRAGYAPNRQTDFLVASLMALQQADGSWHLGGYSRSPMQDSNFSRTAMAMRALKTYGTPGRAAEIKDRLERARQWLMHAEPVITEDWDMRLAGVAAAGASRAQIQTLARPILARQQPDGGWAQRDGFPSDAYATGLTLWALSSTRILQYRQDAYQRAVKFLLSTQAADGSWHVASRATKFQDYFESGFPYEHDQWISTMATGWAASALSLAIHTPPQVAQAR